MYGSRISDGSVLWRIAERVLHAVCLGFAIFGGALLCLVALLTVVSILGRAVFGAGLGGDYELVEMGCATAIFTFLPYCQYVRAHARVDFFTQRLGSRLKGILDGLADLLFALIAALIAWRLAEGGLDLWRYGESTMVLRLPVWWGFVPAVLSFALLALLCAYGVLRRFRVPNGQASGG
ncbi:TRAP transporter small permease [Fodinicurvata halophila]|uniref:TRAP transporter small permease protein n=1 Tax=Fodinicurvata halophila TaxID=1419723 RepID=A0ABV8URH6_9PROT